MTSSGSCSPSFTQSPSPNFQPFKDQFFGRVQPHLKSYVASMEEARGAQFSEFERRDTTCITYDCANTEPNIDIYVVGRPYREVKSTDFSPFPLGKLPSQVHQIAKEVFSEKVPEHHDYECELEVSKLVDVYPLSLEEFTYRARQFVQFGAVDCTHIRTETQKEAFSHALLLTRIQKIVGNSSTHEALRFIQPIELMQVDVEQAIKEGEEGVLQSEKWLARWRALTEDEVSQKIQTAYPGLTTSETLSDMIQSIQAWRSLNSNQLKEIDDDVLTPIFEIGDSKVKLDSFKQRLKTPPKYCRLDKVGLFGDSHHRISIRFQPGRYFDLAKPVSEEEQEEEAFETPRASPKLLKKPRQFDQVPDENLDVKI